MMLMLERYATTVEKNYSIFYILAVFRGLKNDSVPETFQLCATVKGHYLPVQYLKIVPLQSW